MKDIRQVAAAISAAGPPPSARFRQGTIQSVNADGTCTVTVGAGVATATNVRVASHTCPVPGAGCWLVTDGRDWIVWATIPPDGPAYASARKTTAQAIPTGSWTAFDWTSRSASSNGITLGNDGLTIVVPGLYQITASVDFVSNATGQRHCALYINGAVSVQGTGGDAAAGSDISRLMVSTVVPLAVGDLVNVYAYQSSGANLNTSAAASYNILRAAWIGPNVVTP